jgi:predicted transcriptional regulator
VGVFTEQSVIRMLAEGAQLDETAVSDYCDPHFFVARASEPIETVWKSVAQSGARFICVTDDDGRLVGLTGQRGLAEYLCDCYAGQVTVQRLGSAPWMLQREGA